MKEKLLDLLFSYLIPAVTAIIMLIAIRFLPNNL
nr:MAG TPA: hypothetical protein [Caudoviricetes sp.]DAR59529.1 MAG TPA: hypothetical protein [Caudoviricetes sp.]